MNIAIIYHPSDAEVAETCRVHLAPLGFSRRHRILACSSEAAAPTLEARVVVILLSARLSLWWSESPIAVALEARHDAKLAKLIPVRLRSCEIGGRLASLQALPRVGAPPILESRFLDEAWTNLAKEVGRVVEAFERA